MYYIIYLSLKAARDISIGVHNPFPIFLFRFLPFISPFHCAATTTSWGTTLLDPLPNPPAAAEEAMRTGTRRSGSEGRGATAGRAGTDPRQPLAGSGAAGGGRRGRGGKERPPPGRRRACSRRAPLPCLAAAEGIWGPPSEFSDTNG